MLKQFCTVLICCLLITSCGTNPARNTSSLPENSQNAPAESSSQSASAPEPIAERTDEEYFNEIMCLFGAEPRIEYTELGEPEKSGATEYQTSVISFYYADEGVSSASEITPYGFYGWYLEYTLAHEEEIANVFPDFERTSFIRTDPVSGEIYGASADNYEAIVTSFFDVSAEELRSNDLYDQEAHAYIPITGPGRGEQPTIRITTSQRQGDLIILDIVVESSPAKTFQLTVREDKGNRLAGIRFVSLVPVPAGATFSDGPNGTTMAHMTEGDTFLGFTLDRLDVAHDDSQDTPWFVEADFTGMATLKGRISRDATDDLMGNVISFTVAEESVHLLPYALGDTRDVWFGFTNNDEVQQLIGEESFDFECEITISFYHIIHYPSMVWNTATLVELNK